ncbi:MAG TPA: hypothetical protein VF796_20100 [Humisphaera sp.]
MRSIVAAVLVLLAPLAGASAAPATAPAVGVPVAYRLPTDGPLPRTYLVTLAVVDAKNPDWIVCQFARGVARTVTRENGGRFSETWDGLDDNHMPVPPGDYAVRGICSPAERWAVDGEYHAVTPRFHSAANPWAPTPADAAKHEEPFGGDPTNAPMGDVAVGPNGLAVFYYEYLENGRNNPVLDLTKPIGFDQVVKSFPSGGAGGGTSTSTDGQTVWSFSTDGGRKFVYRADGKPWGTGGSKDGANRNGVYLPDGWVTAMAALPADGKVGAVVYVAQRGRIIDQGKKRFVESDKDFVDKVTAHDGESGKVLAEVPLRRPMGLAARGETLWALHQREGGRFAVVTTPLTAGVPAGPWKVAFEVPKNINPFGFAIDTRDRVYLSDPAANHVHEFDAHGDPLVTFGDADRQSPGRYDRVTLMAPGKLATWRHPDGEDRLLVVENAGPNRVSEWSNEGGLRREFVSLQTRANDGYAIDPEHPEDVYIPGQQGWLTRFKVDYERHTWTVDAVYPNVGTDPKIPGLVKPVFVRLANHGYLCGSRSGRHDAFPVYRLAGDRWVLSAALVRKPGPKPGAPATYLFWHDANGNGKPDDDEFTPAPDTPPGVFNYHGQNWTADLAFTCINQGGTDVWRLAPSSFDAHGNPVFTKWQRLLADPVFEARAAGKADAVHGGNELAERFTSDWMQADGTPADGYYVQARGGKNFSANEGAQHKLSRYVPDGAGGYKLKWRTGRSVIDGLATPGDIYGGMRVRRPINGLVSVVDQSRCGILLFTDDGLYVDTLFPDGRRFTPRQIGMYSQPGEFFAGTVYPNPADGKIYLAMGKYTASLFEVEGWSLTQNPARPLAEVQKTVTITAGQTASPPEAALALRGGAGVAKLARFAPALGGAATDGSMAGWESAEPVTFAADKDHTVEVRCLYDPEHLYLRWHARLGARFEPKPLTPAERVFTHDRGADTLSFYVQGDPAARPNGPAEGRPGDARFVFGLFKDGGAIRPAVVGMYPKWPAAGGKAQTYATPVGRASFEHVGEVPGAQLGGKVDEDGRGFVVAARLPRSALPAIPAPFAGGYRTTANFSATFGGHNTFWWANSDGSASRETYDEPTEARLYPGSWAPVVFAGVDGGVVVRNWLVCGPFGGPGAEKFRADLNGQMPGTTKDWKQAAKQFAEAATYPPDAGPIDLAAVYRGDLLRGYWPDPREARWKPAEIADLDARVVFGPAAQTWFAATWVYAPKPTEVEFRFQGHPQTTLKWTLNGQQILTGEIKGRPGDAAQRPTAGKTVALRQGWNEVRFRGYCVGYPPFKAGLIVAGPPEVLWQLRFTATPPKAGE